MVHVLGGCSVPKGVLCVLVPFVTLIVRGYQVSVFAFVVGGVGVICWWGQCLGVGS